MPQETHTCFIHLRNEI